MHAVLRQAHSRAAKIVALHRQSPPPVLGAIQTIQCKRALSHGASAFARYALQSGSILDQGDGDRWCRRRGSIQRAGALQGGLKHGHDGLLLEDDPALWMAEIERLATNLPSAKGLAEGLAVTAQRLGDKQTLRLFWSERLGVKAEYTAQTMVGDRCTFLQALGCSTSDASVCCSRGIELAFAVPPSAIYY